VISRASDPFADDIVARQTERADAAHRTLVALADKARAESRQSIATEDPATFEALVVSGAVIGTYVLGPYAVDHASRCIEGVAIHAEKRRKATEADLRRERGIARVLRAPIGVGR
jgi:hypothetical protein